MKKLSEKKLYSKDKSSYLLLIGGSLSGLFDAENNVIGMVKERSGDLYKLIINKEKYIVRHFKRKSCCLMYKITENDISLSNPDIYSLPTINYDCHFVNLWEEFDIQNVPFGET